MTHVIDGWTLNFSTWLKAASTYQLFNLVQTSFPVSFKVCFRSCGSSHSLVLCGAKDYPLSFHSCCQLHLRNLESVSAEVRKVRLRLFSLLLCELMCAQSCLTLWGPMDCMYPASFLCQWNFPGENTGAGCHFLLQGIFPTQGLNLSHPRLLHWQADSLPLNHLGSLFLRPTSCFMWLKWPKKSKRMCKWLRGLACSKSSNLHYHIFLCHLWVRKIPWRRKWQPTPVFLPGKSYGQRSLKGYSLGGRKEADMT